jgi:YbbR domain-containing protein
MAYHPFRHLGLKFLSIALAVLMWLLVADQQMVERAVRAPLEFHNVPEGLELVNDPPDSVEVRLRGSSTLLARLLPGEVVAGLNLQTARPGSRLFHLLADEIRVPYGVQVTQVTPASLSLTFEKMGSRIVPVVPAVEGDPAPGYIAGRVTANPAVVEVVGPMSLLQDLKTATTESIVISQATRTVQDRVTVGVASDKLRLREARTAIVTVEIAPVGVERELQGLVLVDENLADGLKARFLPANVRVVVRGPQKAVEQIEPDKLEPQVDLAGLAAGKFTLPVHVGSLPPQVDVVRIEPASVQVRIW